MCSVYAEACHGNRQSAKARARERKREKGREGVGGWEAIARDSGGRVKGERGSTRTYHKHTKI